VAPGDLLTVFDGDDTLWFVEDLYDQARRSASHIVADLGIDPDEWESQQRLIDLENAKSLGVSPIRFPTSCVQAYESLAVRAHGAVELAAVEQIWTAASNVFRATAPIAPDASRVVSEMRELGLVALLTKGDESIQMQRLEESGLSTAFDAVFVVPEKAADQFRHVLSELDCVAESSWSVGNSLVSDINPALRIGMRGIWIDAHVWEHERREANAVSGRVVEAASLAEVPGIIRNG
jgi:putative hydrolase of the HAD superfamily